MRPVVRVGEDMPAPLERDWHREARLAVLWLPVHQEEGPGITGMGAERDDLLLPASDPARRALADEEIRDVLEPADRLVPVEEAVDLAPDLSGGGAEGVDRAADQPQREIGDRQVCHLAH